VVRFTGHHPRQTDARVALAASEAHGVLCLDELLACGLTEDEIRGRVARGQLHRIHRGVYAVGHPGLTREGRWLAAVKACGGGAVLSHQSAAMLYGFVRWEERLADVTSPKVRSVEGIRTHRTRRTDLRDVRRHHGIPVSSPERVLLELAALWGDAPLRRAMSRAQSLHLANLRTLAAILDRTGSRPGRARYARVLATGPPPTRSELEDRLHDLVLAGGFAAPDVNVPLRIGARTVIPDLRWPAQRLVVEADGALWHDTPQARAGDAERQALLEAHGERVLRVTWAQATRHAAQTLARVSAAGAPRSTT
jgi:very-short-patch-repair endonuclease